MPTRYRLVIAGLMVLSVASCGKPNTTRSAPVEKFDLYETGHRVFESFNDVDGLGHSIAVPATATRIALHFDCRASAGNVALSASGQELVTGGCSTTKGHGKGVVVNDLTPGTRSVDLGVDVPSGGRWSVAVDVTSDRS